MTLSPELPDAAGQVARELALAEELPKARPRHLHDSRLQSLLRQMAKETAGNEEDDVEGKEGSKSVQSSGKKKHERDDGTEASEEEEEDEEPRLKYASLTRNLRAVYKNGDATSAFLVAGDKMIIGTHNGNIHVLSVPSLASIRAYRAHSASISSVSVSPYPPPLDPAKLESSNRTNSEKRRQSPAPRGSPAQKAQQAKPVPSTPSNMIYIATSSIDGNVCISSLTDPKDVMLRNFGRPVKAVSLSPEYKSDRSYLSGGLAGSLVLTVGGRAGTSTTSSTTGGAVASASGWLGSMGLSANTGKDQVLHSGEGSISTIKWSLSGDYVAWVNEQGIKIMRTNLHLESSQSDRAWKRISHIDHPNRPGWDEMAGIWKAHVEWIDENGLESDDNWSVSESAAKDPNKASNGVPLPQKVSKKVEKLVVGWSGTIWIVNVHREREPGKDIHHVKPGRAEVVTILRIDCIISGISLYTPNLLLVLAYVSPDDDPAPNQKPSKPGVHRRRNALQPEIRIIDINTKEEVSVADQLRISRYETLSATDYHLGVLPAMRFANKVTTTKGALETLGGGIEAIGGGLWDATKYPVRMFSTTASIRSGGSPGSSKAPSVANVQTTAAGTTSDETVHPSALAHGMKVFIHSPYDCIIATKPTISDHYGWLESHDKYQEVWDLLDQHPEALAGHFEQGPGSAPSTPSKTQGSLLEFFDDESTSIAATDGQWSVLQVGREKNRLGEKWIQQLVSASQWQAAGEVCGKVLQTSSSWEHWVWTFAQAEKYDELAPFIPTVPLHPPLPSIVYELMLGHYVSEDAARFKDLLERWPPELYSAETVIEAIQARLRAIDSDRLSAEEVENSAPDRQFLTQGLAKLYLAISRADKALSCYIRLQDADAAMDLITNFHLVGAVADDIPGFILLRVSKEAQQKAPLSELSAQTLEPIQLLVSEAYRGNVLPDTVITQLEEKYGVPNPYLYFYFRALWNGDSATRGATTTPRKGLSIRKQAAEERLIVQEGQSLVSDHPDTAVTLFAEYDRALLMQFLKSSATYNLSLASRICEQRQYIPELVYLLSKGGRTAEALRLIIDSLDDVSQAIAFAKEQDDASLWDDLLDYAMNKPRFIRGLLEEVGTSIDPLKLVQRIPLGLEIEGLRDGLARMLKEYEVQLSISGGVARVLRGEVHHALQERSQGIRKGVKIDVSKAGKAAKKKAAEIVNDQQPQPSSTTKANKQKNNQHHHSSPTSPATSTSSGHCAACSAVLNQRNSHRSYLLAFPCTHVFHVACLLRYGRSADYEPPLHYSLFDVPAEDDSGDEAEDETAVLRAGLVDRSMGPKIDRAALLRDVVHDLGGCPLEESKKENG